MRRVEPDGLSVKNFSLVRRPVVDQGGRAYSF